MLSGSYHFGEFELRAEEHVLLNSGEECEIGARAFDVLRVLLEQHGSVVPREALIEAAWPGLIVEENNLTVQISGLRKLLGRNAIKTIPGRGYQFSIGVRGVRDVNGADSGLSHGTTSSEPETQTNLPARMPTLFGRDDELAEVKLLLQDASLVTVVGSAGIGKTSLAKTVAMNLGQNFSDGVWLVELASLTDSALIPLTVARAMRIALPGQDRAARELVSMLRRRRALVVLDNCEHLIEGIRSFADELLRDAGELVLLATSQERIRIPEEQTYQLGSLAVPASAAAVNPDQFGAVSLFIERARAFDSKFDLSNDNAVAVCNICQQLEGIPLALELAAARIHMYGASGVLERLTEGFRVLGKGTQLNPRHWTLDAALTWSHDLLSESEQAVFRRLGLFVGGFSLAGAQGVVVDGCIDEWDAVEHLSSLVDKSLVAVDHGQLSRYRMLETTRRYALDRLDEARETDQIAKRHALHTLSLTRNLVRARETQLLIDELNNVRAAYTWAMGPGKNPEVAIGLATYSSVVMAVDGFVAEALQRLVEVKPYVDDGIPMQLAAQYWQWLGRVGTDGRLPVSECIDALERAQMMFHTLGNDRHEHACLRMKAQALTEIVEFSAASAAISQAMAMEGKGLPLADKMRRLRVQGMLEERTGLYPEALETWAQAAALAQAGKTERYELILLADTAGACLKMGNFEGAIAQYEDLVSRSRGRHIGGLTLSYALSGLMAVHLKTGEVNKARSVAIEAVPHLVRSGLFHARSDVLALLLVHEKKFSEAAMLIGAADARRRISGSKRDASEAALRTETVQGLQASLTSAQVDARMSEGSTLSEDDLVALLD